MKTEVISGKKYQPVEWNTGDCKKCAFSDMSGKLCVMHKSTIAFDCLDERFDGGAGVYFIELEDRG